MFERIRLRTFSCDNTQETNARYCGVLSEAIASKKLALEMLKSQPPGTDREQAIDECTMAIQSLEAQLQIARHAITRENA